MARRTEETAAPHQPAGAAPAFDLASEHLLRVLVAEDSHVNQIVVRAHLERVGYHPDLVGDGAEGIEAGMVARLAKPLVAERLVEVLRSVRPLVGDSRPHVKPSARPTEEAVTRVDLELLGGYDEGQQAQLAPSCFLPKRART